MTKWVTTGTALPEDGDAVQFIVERRSLMFCGIYEQCTFKSRWSEYSPVEVVEWRKIRAPPFSGLAPMFRRSAERVGRSGEETVRSSDRRRSNRDLVA